MAMCLHVLLCHMDAMDICQQLLPATFEEVEGLLSSQFRFVSFVVHLETRGRVAVVCRSCVEKI